MEKAKMGGEKKKKKKGSGEKDVKYFTLIPVVPLASLCKL